MRGPSRAFQNFLHAKRNRRILYHRRDGILPNIHWSGRHRGNHILCTFHLVFCDRDAILAGVWRGADCRPVARILHSHHHGGAPCRACLRYNCRRHHCARLAEDSFPQCRRAHCPHHRRHPLWAASAEKQPSTRSEDNPRRHFAGLYALFLFALVRRKQPPAPGFSRTAAHGFCFVVSSPECSEEPTE